MGSGLGLSQAKLNDLDNYGASAHFSEVERLALRYADSMTITGQDSDDALFEQLRSHFSDDALVELTAVIAWENASSKFNHALRVPSQGLWRRTEPG